MLNITRLVVVVVVVYEGAEAVHLNLNLVH